MLYGGGLSQIHKFRGGGISKSFHRKNFESIKISIYSKKSHILEKMSPRNEQKIPNFKEFVFLSSKDFVLFLKKHTNVAFLLNRKMILTCRLKKIFFF